MLGEAKNIIISKDDTIIMDGAGTKYVFYCKRELNFL